MREYIVILMILSLLFVSKVSGFQQGVITGNITIIDKDNKVIFSSPITAFLGKNITFYNSSFDLLNKFTWSHLYITPTPLPNDYYTILMNTISPNIHYEQDIINSLNLLLSGNVSSYYLYTVSYDYNYVLIMSINQGQKYLPRQVRLRSMNVTYELVNKLGIVVRWVHTYNIEELGQNSVLGNNRFIITSMITDGSQLIKLFEYKSPSIHIYRVNDYDYYFLNDVNPSTEITSIYDILPDLQSGKVVYLYFPINEYEDIYIEVVPVRVINNNVYKIIQDYGGLKNVSVWGYVFYGDNNIDGSDYDVVEELKNNIFYGDWLSFVLDYLTFDGIKNLTREQWSNTGYTLYYGDFTDNISLETIIDSIYNEGIMFLGLTKKLSNGEFVTVKYLLRYLPDYSYKILRVRDYNGTTPDPTFLNNDEIMSTIMLTKKIYSEKNDIYEVDIYSNDTLEQSVSGILFSSIDFDTLYSFIEDVFYDNPNYTRMIVIYNDVPEHSTEVTKVRPDFTQEKYMFTYRVSDIIWRIRSSWFWGTSTTKITHYFQEVNNITSMINITRVGIVGGDDPKLLGNDNMNPFSYFSPIDDPTYEEYENNTINQPYLYNYATFDSWGNLNFYKSISIYSVSAYLQKLADITFRDYNVSMYTFAYTSRGFNTYLHEFVFQPHVKVVTLNETSTDFHIVNKNIYVPIYGVTEITLESLLSYNVKVNSVEIYVNGVNGTKYLFGNYNNTIIKPRSPYTLLVDAIGIMSNTEPVITIDTFLRTRVIDDFTMTVIVYGVDELNNNIELRVTSDVQFIYVV